MTDRTQHSIVLYRRIINYNFITRERDGKQDSPLLELKTIADIIAKGVPRDKPLAVYYCECSAESAIIIEEGKLDLGDRSSESFAPEAHQ